MEDIRRISFNFRQLLNKPHKVAVICVFVFTISLFINGSLWRVWALRRDHTTIQAQIDNAQKKSTTLDMQIKQAKDPVFIERQARDKLDLVSDNDLVFVFPE